MPSPSPEHDSRTMQFENTMKGIREYSLHTLSDEECQLFATAFHYFMTPDPTKNLLSWSKDIVAITSQYGISMPHRDANSDEYRVQSAKECIEIAHAQIHLLNSPPVHITYQNEFQVGMKYFPTSWGGCGGVKFSLADSASPNMIDTFALLGIPHSKDNILGFDITTMQPWLQDDWPAISMAETDEQVERVKEINRLSDRLLRLVSADTDVSTQKIPLSKTDMYLLLTLPFLQKNNVRAFRGRSDEEIQRHYPRVNINYDKVFKKWFDTKDSASTFAWQMDTGSHGCYIPHFENVPAAIKPLLIDIYHA